MNFMSEKASLGTPFFMQVSYYAVHRRVRSLQVTQQKYESLPRGKNHDNPEHAAMTEDLDTGVGQVLDKIKELGIEDNTYVIYFSDNGAYMILDDIITNNIPLAKGKCHVWEGGIRVPLVIKGPGIVGGTQSDVPVVAYDFFPSIKSILNLDAPLPDGLEGGDLMPLLTGSDNANVERPRKEIVWHFPHYVDNKGVTPQSAIRMGDFKFIHLYETGEDFLFDLRGDLEESKNLVESHSARAKDLRERLDRYLEDVDAGMPKDGMGELQDAARGDTPRTVPRT
jgi:arylsulfatase A-like enzyme